MHGNCPLQSILKAADGALNGDINKCTFYAQIMEDFGGKTQ